MNTIVELWNRLHSAITIIRINDILDILIVAFLIYQLLRLTRSKSAGQIVRVVILLLVLSAASTFLGLNTLNFIISKVLEIGLIALVVVFQPELRRLLERLGGTQLFWILGGKDRSVENLRTVEETVKACQEMSRQKVGALIVFERENNLEEYFSTGTIVNADVSEELLKNIFFPKAALHDGAVVIRHDRIAAAGCVLPLSENPDLSRDLGTRHRAAIGISEHSDSLVVVVSEETGVISCASGGTLRRYMTPETLSKYLKTELLEDDTAASNPLSGLLDKVRKDKGGSGNEEK